jgi:hypothetical protein
MYELLVTLLILLEHDLPYVMSNPYKTTLLRSEDRVFVLAPQSEQSVAVFGNTGTWKKKTKKWEREKKDDCLFRPSRRFGTQKLADQFCAPPSLFPGQLFRFITFSGVADWLV